MESNKGFITVATGSEKYYILAYNLLRSFRYHSKSPMPFAILCDRHNTWTEAFDEVVTIENPAFSFFDKLRILDLSPFDETIFIDADSLVYKDLSGLWDLFKNSPDVGVLGAKYPIDSNEGWWKAENLGDLRDKVDYKITCQGGIYFIRNNGKDLPAFIETCKFIQDHYLDYHFSIFETKLEDETILCLASAVHHFLPVTSWQEVFVYYQESRIIKSNILSGELVIIMEKEPDVLRDNALLIHFGTTYALNRWHYKKAVFMLKSGGVRLSNFWEYCSLRLSHALKKVIKTISRWMNSKSRYTLEVYY